MKFFKCLQTHLSKPPQMKIYYNALLAIPIWMGNFSSPYILQTYIMYYIFAFSFCLDQL